MNQMKSFAVLGAMALALPSASPAKAALSLTFQTFYQPTQTNVVATGSGTLNLNGLTPATPFTTTATAGLNPTYAVTVVGQFTETVHAYTGYTGGPLTFSPGPVTVASSGSGPQIGIQGAIDGFSGPVLTVPVTYVSGTPIFSTSEFDNTTLAQLGLTPGEYTYSWGSGADADSFTVDVMPAPEPASALMLLSALGGLVGLRQFRRRV